MPAKAAICGFEMHTADSGVTLGKVKERLAAQAQHERDLQEGKKTALLGHSTDDGSCRTLSYFRLLIPENIVFVTSIGPVPGNESITIVTTVSGRVVNSIDVLLIHGLVRHGSHA